MKSLLHIKDVTKTYTQKNQPPIKALKGVSLDIFPGEIITLLGVNGAGKSTLSSIIATLHPASSGELLFNGISIYQDLITYRSAIGFCPQKPNLDTMLTLEQILMFAGRFYGMSQQACQTRLHQLVDQLGLGDYLASKAGILSGGYKQRFMIARALMHTPQMVILDEPTVGLDPHIRRQLWTIIKDLKNHGITVILTTHYLDEAQQLSDRVCILDKGLIKLIDTPEKLMADFKKNNLEDVFLSLLQETPEKNVCKEIV
jgi:ABC-2 type transport system ATP-binding protein